MSKYEDEIKKDIRDRLILSNKKLWKSLSSEMQKKVVDTYYKIRDVDYSNINRVLRENANSRREVNFIFIGVFLGIFGNIIADVVVKYFPARDWVDDLAVAVFFLSALLFLLASLSRDLSRSLEDDRVLLRLIEIVIAEKI